MALIVAAVFGYLLGSVPFGLLFTRLAGLGDIRSIGSGNIGATNVLRTGRKGLAFCTLVFDGGKGAFAAGIATWMAGTDAGLVAGAVAVIGHNFPVWLSFKGGKGVATTLGVFLITSWPVGVGACLTWLVIAFLFRISSLAALVALALSPVYALIFATPAHALAALILAVLGIARHHTNIRRLLRGEEPRIGKKKES
ncbi:MAG: glycerol-3-phosphate 1-O-acyltransferase PlsY [Telmatospirillum sp.]|nr:glycerol-3-phosphate 1-O-acyltransferase PlsY [Telmatospirillum sp.]